MGHTAYFENHRDPYMDHIAVNVLSDNRKHIMARRKMHAGQLGDIYSLYNLRNKFTALINKPAFNLFEAHGNGKEYLLFYSVKLINKLPCVDICVKVFRTLHCHFYKEGNKIHDAKVQSVMGYKTKLKNFKQFLSILNNLKDTDALGINLSPISKVVQCLQEYKCKGEVLDDKINKISFLCEQHLTVNHNLHFVNLITHATTNHIESTWQKAKTKNKVNLEPQAHF